MKILHLTAHLGAGAGKAIAGIALADKGNSHSIVLTDNPEKLDYVEKCRQRKINVYICPEENVLLSLLHKADVVVVNWWQHPSLFPVMLKLGNVSARVVLWSHINGLYYPAISVNFADAFDACIYTSEVSLSISYWTSEERERIEKKSNLVYGMGSFLPEKIPQKEEYSLHQPIRMGYVGSLDKAKMHPEFFDWCKRVLQDCDICLMMAGDPLPDFVHDLEISGLKDKIQLLGYQKDIPNLLRTFDIFVYLLNPQNFATTENALLEAMAAGLPVVTSDGAAETTIIANGQTGYVVGDAEAFVTNVKKMIASQELRERLGRQARKYVIQKYNLDDNLRRFSSVVEMVCGLKKRQHDFSHILGKTPFEWFISGCREEDALIFHCAANVENEVDIQTIQQKMENLGQIYKGKAKGSVYQFSEYFSEDEKLKKICKMMKNG